MTSTWEDQHRKSLEVLEGLLHAYRIARRVPRAELAIELETIMRRELGYLLYDSTWLNKVAMDMLSRNPTMSVRQAVDAVTTDA